jgi:hypothetical protein
MKHSEQNVDLSFLIGQSLVQICFGSHQIQFNLSEGAGVQAESRVVLSTAAGAFEFNQPYDKAGELLLLLDAEIGKAEIESNGDLLLGFSNERALKIVNDEGPYESYQISGGPTSIIV